MAEGTLLSSMSLLPSDDQNGFGFSQAIGDELVPLGLADEIARRPHTFDFAGLRHRSLPPACPCVSRSWPGHSRRVLTPCACGQSRAFGSSIARAGRHLSTIGCGGGGGGGGGVKNKAGDVAAVPFAGCPFFVPHHSQFAGFEPFPPLLGAKWPRFRGCSTATPFSSFCFARGP